MAKDSRRAPYWEPTADWLTKHKVAIAAVKAVYEGIANEGQQKLALAFIMEELCERTINQYFPSQRDTDFALGKKFVGDHIAGIVKAKLGQIQEPK